MPLFFFLSGLFLCRSVARLSAWDFLSDRIRAIAYPYFVWSAITVLLKSTLGSIPNTPRGLSDLSLLAFAPIEQYWFLYVLFLLTLLFGALLRSMSPWLVAVVATVIYPGIVPFSSGWYVLQEVREFGIYVALGAIVGSNYLSQRFAVQCLGSCYCRNSRFRSSGSIYCDRLSTDCSTSCCERHSGSYGISFVAGPRARGCLCQFSWPPFVGNFRSTHDCISGSQNFARTDFCSFTGVAPSRGDCRRNFGADHIELCVQINRLSNGIYVSQGSQARTGRTANLIL